jgi:hypothetical protein
LGWGNEIKSRLYLLRKFRQSDYRNAQTLPEHQQTFFSNENEVGFRGHERANRSVIKSKTSVIMVTLIWIQRPKELFGVLSDYDSWRTSFESCKKWCQTVDFTSDYRLNS